MIAYCLRLEIAQDVVLRIINGMVWFGGEGGHEVFWGKTDDRKKIAQRPVCSLSGSVCVWEIDLELSPLFLFVCMPSC